MAKRSSTYGKTTARMVALIKASTHPIPRGLWMSQFRNANSATALLVAMGIVEPGPGSGGMRGGRSPFTEEQRAAALKTRQAKAAAKAEAKRLAKVERLRKELEALETPIEPKRDGLPPGVVRRGPVLADLGVTTPFVGQRP